MIPNLSHFWVSLVALLGSRALAVDTLCSFDATRLHLSDPPYENYFYSDCHSSSHIVVTSPLSTSNLSLIEPRLVIAWPSGNSGIISSFAPENGINGTLAIRLENSTTNGNTLEPIYVADTSNTRNPRVGVSGWINFNSSAILTVPILGSIRTIREFTEGPKKLQPSVQKAIRFSKEGEGGVTLKRTWFDNVTTTWLTFTPVDKSNAVTIHQDLNTTLIFPSGTYQFNASFDYPQLVQLSPQEVLNNASMDLAQQNAELTSSLSFLSYTDKLLAGTWRFLTYFGRDSMISLLLLQPILRDGQGGAIEAVIGSVLERINSSDGTVCHEENLGDYATFLNLEKNISSTEPQCDYKMIDTDYFLPVVMKNYLVDTETGRNRAEAFLNTRASFLSKNVGLSYSKLALLTAEKIMRISAPFAAKGGQIKRNLVHLERGKRVGQWRDSADGLGGGRIPYDVNTALVPAGLRAIAALSKAGLFPEHPEWVKEADQYAEVWEDETLRFFEVSVSQADAVSLVEKYKVQSRFSGPSNVDAIRSNVTFYGLALDGMRNQSIVRVMNTDDCFRHFLLNTTNQVQLSNFLEQTAEHILRPFPVGLSSDVGLFVANPAYGGDPRYARRFTNKDYHGTVIWSWQLAMMAAGLGRQLGRCVSMDMPDFCIDHVLYTKVLSAYEYLWTLIENNRAQLSSEVWSWTYNNGFQAHSLGAFSSTESNIRQLWSLTFLAVHKEDFRQRPLRGAKMS